MLVGGCPDLSAPPFGTEAKGKRLSGRMAPAEQQTLDRLVPGAQMDYVICQYAKRNSARPGVEINVRAFRGQNGKAQATTLADVEQGSTSESYADFVVVPGSGDNGGFAWYEGQELGMATHAGNNYVVVTAYPGTAVTQDPDSRKVLQKQVPTLTAIMDGVLDALR